MTTSRKQRTEALPASSAGLLRFFEDETHGVKIRPEYVIAFGAAIGLASILLRIFF
ncbi:MAG: preprotein translocase subunit Sec61beta [Thaumarchaeota archaeon]|nr:preprotein translocase subunit Sec61beta [Nitrososphaerota archaeon]MCZ6725202.1 preprotein translocase subunit Sec61beta [Nitrososphaerota archaeon]